MRQHPRLLLMALAHLAVANAAGGAPTASVVLAPEHGSYALGAPVALRMTVQNLGMEQIGIPAFYPTFADFGHRGISLRAGGSEPARNHELWAPHAPADESHVTPIIRLGPGEQWTV